MTSHVANDLKRQTHLVDAELGETLQWLGDLPGPLAGSHSLLPVAGSCYRGDSALAGSPNRLGAQASQKSTAGISPFKTGGRPKTGRTTTGRLT